MIRKMTTIICDYYLMVRARELHVEFRDSISEGAHFCSTISDGLKGRPFRRIDMLLVKIFGTLLVWGPYKWCNILTGPFIFHFLVTFLFEIVHRASIHSRRPKVWFTYRLCDIIQARKIFKFLDPSMLIVNFTF